MLNFAQSIINSHNANINACGCSVQLVEAESDGTFPTFAYSIGFAKAGLPDVFIAGPIDGTTLLYIINNVFALWTQEGYSLGEKQGILGNDLGVLLLPVGDPSKLKVGVNLTYYGVHPEHYKVNPELPRFVQILWPDTSGKYPTDDGYDARFFQPLFATQLS